MNVAAQTEITCSMCCTTQFAMTGRSLLGEKHHEGRLQMLLRSGSLLLGKRAERFIVLEKNSFQRRLGVELWVRHWGTTHPRRHHSLQ
jgi:hypothetical protein